MPDSTSSGGPYGKRATRRSLLSRRDALTAEQRAEASRVIADGVRRLVEERLVAGDVIALYAAKGSEVATDEIDRAARALGLRVVYPRISDHDKQLAFAEVGREELVASRFGLREPEARVAAIATARIAAFVIPGLAFDRAGGRIGWGRGHYDATLAQVPEALRIALAFECQLVEVVPREAHDIPVHFIITEAATHVVA